MKQQPDLTIICFCRSVPPQEKIEKYRSVSGQLILIQACQTRLPLLSRELLVLPWKPENGKVAALNRAIKHSSGAYILWLEENETLPEIPDLLGKKFYPARISNIQAEIPAVNWQIRLFPNLYSTTLFFAGFEIPDIYPALNNTVVQQSNHSLTINRDGVLFPIKDIQQEVNEGSNIPIHDFWKGILASEKKQFSLAVRCFKKALKNNSLAYWNRLATLNCLSNALVEVRELQKAREIAEKSLAITTRQRAPYLTIYQYYNLKGEDEEAYQQLVQYQRAVKTKTEANWDVSLPQTHATFLMAEISYQQGWHEKAYHHYEQLFTRSNGQVDRSILEKLFLYSVELKQHKKGKRYFEALFGDYLSGRCNNIPSMQLMEALSLIMEKGWYDFASEIYGQLVNQRPENESLRRGWIRTLVKNDQLEKAQTLL